MFFNSLKPHGRSRAGASRIGDIQLEPVRCISRHFSDDFCVRLLLHPEVLKAYHSRLVTTAALEQTVDYGDGLS